MKWVALLGCLLAGAGAQAQIDRSPRGEAQWMLERLTGVKWPADTAQLNDMATKIAAGDRIGAADIAVNMPQFLDVTVKQYALQMSTREETVREEFNDFTAMFIGVARDGNSAKELLTGNYFYMANPSVVTVPSNMVNDLLLSNNHYRELAKQNVSLSAALQRVDGQLIESAGNAVANPDPAGVITSRAFLGAHALAGTNRRLVEYTFREFMCVRIENWADTNASDIRIGRDVSRFPGGDHNRYQTNCKGCHTQMDSFRGAFAKWDFVENRAAYIGVSSVNIPTNNGVVTKMNRPTFIEYAGGYVTTNDSWINNSRGLINSARFGWGGANVAGGNGVKTFAQLIADSQRFPTCLAQRAWAAICKYDLPQSEAEAVYINLGDALKSGQYKLKELFKAVAAHPKCRM